MKKIIEKILASFSKMNRTQVYVVEIQFLFILTLILLGLAGFISSIDANPNTTATQITITFALAIAGLNMLSQMIKVVFEAIKHDIDNKK